MFSIWGITLLAILIQNSIALNTLLLPLLSHDQRILFHCRNVPGEGSCLFHALATCIIYNESQKHADFDSKEFKNLSSFLRRKAVAVLSENNRTFHVEDDHDIDSDTLLRMTAEQYNTSICEYCDKMKLESTWGGGPEIVALANYLQKPIHVYELAVRGFWKKHFRLKLLTRIGSPRFDVGSRPLCILCADGRFPGIAPGEQKENGDHFQALLDLRKKIQDESANTVKPSALQRILRQIKKVAYIFG